MRKVRDPFSDWTDVDDLQRALGRACDGRGVLIGVAVVLALAGSGCDDPDWARVVLHECSLVDYYLAVPRVGLRLKQAEVQQLTADLQEATQGWKKARSSIKAPEAVAYGDARALKLQTRAVLLSQCGRERQPGKPYCSNVEAELEANWDELNALHPRHCER